MIARAQTAPRPRSPYQQGGFSLIELLAVMVVVGILAAAAIVSLDPMVDARAGMGAHQLTRDLTFARQRAVATGTRSWVTFDTGAETWTILAEDPSNPGKANATVIIDPATGAEFVQSLDVGSFAGVTLVSAKFPGNNDKELGFDWLGRPLDKDETPLTSQGTVELTGNHTVTVEAGSGHITYVAP